ELETDENYFATIEVKSEDFEWGILLGERGPFFTSVVLTAKKSIDEEPLAYANDWNLSHIAPIVVFDDPASESPFVDEDGKSFVMIYWRIYFWSGVSKEYLSNSIASFHEDVCELLGLEMVDDEADDDDVSVPVRGEHDPIDRLLQIQLELRLRAPQSSRELARALKTTKYEVNNVLYHQPELFEKEGTSPPMWSNKGEIK
ncbi:MAG: hypothetical protein O3A54_06620, partial [Actinobacteria bacterium]|nr:hypothetical protein [Actinomycetota bacterium]